MCHIQIARALELDVTELLRVPSTLVALPKIEIGDSIAME